MDYLQIFFYTIKILRRVAHTLDEWLWWALNEVKKNDNEILKEGYAIFPHNIFNIIGQCVYDRIPTFLEIFPSSFEYFFSLMKYSNIQYIQCHSHWTGWPRQEDSDLYWNIFHLLLRDIFFLFWKMNFCSMRVNYINFLIIIPPFQIDIPLSINIPNICNISTRYSIHPS